MNSSPFVVILPNADRLVEEVARQWLDLVAASAQDGAPHTVALSGGRSATKFFTSVVIQNRTRGVSFSNVHFFWADERCVPPTDPESNFKLASEVLFGPLEISASQIHRLKGEDAPETAAREASTELVRIAPANAAGQPVLDLVFLGMGEDGHIASLFPAAGAEVLNCTTPFLVIRNSPKPPPTRLSLSYATLAAAKNIWTLVSGAGKEGALHTTLTTGATPLGKVMASNPNTKLFTDLNVAVDLPN